MTNSINQILEQKASGQIKLDGFLEDSNGEPILQRSYDSKTILLIGNMKKEIDNSSNSTKIRRIKKRH